MRAISLATVFVAAAGYLVIWIASNALSPQGYVHFMVFWGLFFALTGLIDGLMQETTRGVATQTQQHATGPTARPLALAAYFAAFFGVVSLLTSPLWIGQVSPGHEVWGATLISLGLASFVFQAVLCGIISAHGAWRTFAWLIAIDSGIRLLLAVCSWILGWSVVAFLIITVVGAATWLVFVLFSPAIRSVIPQATDVPAGQFASRGIKAMLASGANAILITGFSVILQFTTSAGTGGAALAGTITAVTLARAPLLVPLQRFQPALIVHFTKNRQRVLRAAAAPMTAVTAIAAFGGCAAWLIGQPIMSVLFAEAYIVSPTTLGLLTLASGSTALLMITGCASLAAERHNLYWIGWAIATVAAVCCLLLDASPEFRAILALGIGPLLGVITHLGVLSLSVDSS